LSEPESATDPTPEREAERAFVEDHVRRELLPNVIVGSTAPILHEALGATLALSPPKPGE